MRQPLVMGNWKLNGSRHMVNELIANLRKDAFTDYFCFLGGILLKVVG